MMKSGQGAWSFAMRVDWALLGVLMGGRAARGGQIVRARASLIYKKKET
jgi:hypothetical protein